MKKTSLSFLTVVVLISLGLWFLLRGSRNPVKGGLSAHAMGQYTVYTGSEPGLMVSLEYPEGWTLHEERGKIERYREARIHGPRNQDDTYTSYLVVRGSPVTSFGGRHGSLDELVAHYKAHLIRDTRIVSEHEAAVADTNATDLTVSYTLPPLLHKGIKPLAVPVKTRTVFVENSPYIYELIYSADAREYDRYAEAFEHVLKTFRFR